MATQQLPCDGEGICMICKAKPSEQESITCKTCVTPWHITCLSSKPETLQDTLTWECPDCVPIPTTDSTPDLGFAGSLSSSSQASDLIAAIRAIQSDESLNEEQKAKKRQKLMSNGKGDVEEEIVGSRNGDDDAVLGGFSCSFCMLLPERPVTTPCGHNFCLKCFQKWIGQGKRTCAKCRATIPAKMASQPRINASLVDAIRHAKNSKVSSSSAVVKVSPFIHNQQRPDKAFTTERAKKTGKANASSGKIFVTCPEDHFGPILAEHDPVRNTGVLVGESWEDRLECRQWMAHRPHVAGICGQSDYGAQSVALSGGYEDDEDHGEWFLYTGSGGRDLSGNKRTNKSQSFDQKFDKMNEALRVSCKKGYPVRVVRDCIRVRSYEVGKGDRVRFWEDTWIGERPLCKDFGDFYAMSNKKNCPLKDFIVVENDIASWDIDLRLRFNDWEIDVLAALLARLGTPPVLNEQEDKLVLAHHYKGSLAVRPWSHKEKRSAYAPESGVRYDGVYRIEKCWRKVGIQGYKVCRYLFVRCDDAPAPWTSDEHGDRPRPLPDIDELKEATDVTERKSGPSWDFDEEDSLWKWKKAPPASQKKPKSDGEKRTRKSSKGQDQKQRLRALSCMICKKVLNLPVTAPCSHNFCKSCIEATFAGKTHVRERIDGGSRVLRTKKNVMKCPVCSYDISDFLKNPQVNREMMGLIESLQRKSEKVNDDEESGGVDEEESEAVDEEESAADEEQNTTEDEPKNSKRRKIADGEVGSEEEVAVASGRHDSPLSTLHVDGAMEADNSSEGVSINEGNDSSSSSPNAQSD